MDTSRRNIRTRIFQFFLLLGCLVDIPSYATESTVADVVVIVDTSISMSNPGMDPERTSLLVTKLLSDIVPGELSVVRLLGITADQDVLHWKPMGIQATCTEGGIERPCGRVEPTSDWENDTKRDKLGAIQRPHRGNMDFKRKLESHLEQRIGNSLFYLSFRSAQGVFEEHHQNPGKASLPRTIVWLSDGKPDHPNQLFHIITKLQNEHNVAIETIIFGQGDTSFANVHGLHPKTVSTPAELMRAFADAFRRIVQAPYNVDNVVITQPNFEMKEYVDEAWVVIYGNDSLQKAWVVAPNGTSVKADDAMESWSGAGAYRIAHLISPVSGIWKVHATGGGAGTAYAVVQYSSLRPELLTPKTALSGIDVPLVVGIKSGKNNQLVTDTDLLKKLSLDLVIEGSHIRLKDDGTAGDIQANDGKFTTLYSFQNTGDIKLQMHLKGEIIERTTDALVHVNGAFSYQGEALHVDLGTLELSDQSCQPLAIQAEHQGNIPFAVDLLQSIPNEHQLWLNLPSTQLHPAGDARTIAPNDPISVCLATTAKASISSANDETWLKLHVAGSQQADHQVIIHLRWVVNGLTFWQRWLLVLIWVLAILFLLFIILGFVLPQRFQRTLAITFVPELDELDEQSPQPIKQWKGIGIGFYRNARAYLHSDFRISGKNRNVVASLHAEKGGVRTLPSKGNLLWRENMSGEWEEVAIEGCRIRLGDTYRIGENGPFFRIGTRRR